jgi:putative hydrolase of the HAD superfamily
MTAPQQIRYVLFDAGGTLLGTNTDTEHWYEQFFVDACAERGQTVTMEATQHALREAARTINMEQRCSTSEQVRTFWDHVYSATFASLIPGCNSSELANHYIDRFEAGEFVELFRDALPVLEMLRVREIPAGVVSNFGAYLQTFLDHTGIAHFFEFAVVSACVGCEKPGQKIFEHALELAGVPAGQIMFVGDHPIEDYAASARHGMFPVLIDRFNKHADKPDLRRVRALTEIEQWLR